jgi:thymidylate kinase
MHIFIEGPDGVGKSTVIKKLQQILDIPVIKMEKAHKGFTKGIIEDLSYVFNTTLIQFKKYDFIVDRGFLTSIVYSNIYNREFDMDYIYRINNELKPLIILLTVDSDKIFERRPSDKVIDAKERIRIIDEYNDIYDSFTLTSKDFNIKKINTSNLTRDEVFKEVLKIINK